MQCSSLLHLASLVVTLITMLMRFACTRMRDKCFYDISQFSSLGGSEILRAVGVKSMVLWIVRCIYRGDLDVSDKCIASILRTGEYKASRKVAGTVTSPPNSRKSQHSKPGGNMRETSNTIACE